MRTVQLCVLMSGHDDDEWQPVATMEVCMHVRSVGKLESWRVRELES
jgi:hypothetical protein